FDGDRVLTISREKSQFSIAYTGEETWNVDSTLITRFGIINRQNWIETYERLVDLEVQGLLSPAERRLRNELAHRGPAPDAVPMPDWLQKLSFRFPVLFITD